MANDTLARMVTSGKGIRSTSTVIAGLRLYSLTPRRHRVGIDHDSRIALVRMATSEKGIRSTSFVMTGLRWSG